MPINRIIEASLIFIYFFRTSSICEIVDNVGFFESFFNNARYNAIILMDNAGVIQQVNPAFCEGFGYSNEDLQGRLFHVLFTEKDQAIDRPDVELATVLAQGNANDNNYLVNKAGIPIWVTGESIRCDHGEGKTSIMKVIHSIHNQKLLEQLLMESQEFVESILQSVTHAGLLVLDMRMKIITANTAFFDIFQMEQSSLEGHRMNDLDHPFWQNPGNIKQLRETFITNSFYEERQFPLQMADGTAKLLTIYAKPLDGHGGNERRVMLVLNHTKDAHKSQDLI